jgi:hypothetical protein
LIAITTESFLRADLLEQAKDSFNQLAVLVAGVKYAQELFYRRVEEIDAIFAEMRAVPGFAIKAFKIVQEFSLGTEKDAASSAWELVLRRWFVINRHVANLEHLLRGSEGSKPVEKIS